MIHGVVNEQDLPNQPRARKLVELAAITAVAFASRLAWIVFGAWVSGDSAWYLRVARNIAVNHIFSSSADGINVAPTAFRPPLYPTLIAALWFGNSEPSFAVLLLQVLLGTATVTLCYLMARDQFGRGVALLAATGMALAPMTGRFTAVILSETLFTFLLTLGVFLWGRKRYVSTGIVFGVAALTRVTLLPFVVLLPLLTLLRPWRSQRRSYSTIMLISLAVASIWIGRNAIVFDRFIPVAASGYGTNLLLGTLETKDADDLPARKALLRSVDGNGGDPNTDETEFDRVRLRAAFRRIADNPRRWLVARAQQYPRLFIDSGSYVFGDEGIAFIAVLRQGRIGQATIRIGFILGNILVLFFALVGLIVERARFVILSHITLFPIFLSAISLPLWIEPRYGLPMMPLLTILAAVGMVALWGSWRRRAGVQIQQA
jgi:4-amino-4-deoxy-L-arabinose transferase-like glycosyltransferase